PLLLAEAVALLGAPPRLDAGLPPEPQAIAEVLNSSFGQALALRLGAAALLWLLLGLGAGGSHSRAPLRGATGWATGAALVIGAALALLDGLSAHAASIQPLWLGLATNGAHLAAMALWA